MAAHSVERVLAERVQEVRGTDEPLLKVVADGGVEPPPLMSYIEWLTWRRSSETRPHKVVDERTSNPREESSLWRGVMAALHGENWRSDLAEKQETEALEAAEAAGDDVRVTRSPLAARKPRVPQGPRQRARE